MGDVKSANVEDIIIILGAQNAGGALECNKSYAVKDL
jgi:hypothetical protein